VTARSGAHVERLRRALNRFDQTLDRRTMKEVTRISRETGEGAAPATAGEAFRTCLKAARSLDRGARLRLIAAPNTATCEDGTSRTWDFHFHLPRRRAQLACRWELPFDEGLDDFGPARLTATATPFPAPGALLMTLVDQGKMLYRQLNGLWLQERRRGRDLPHRFRDSREVVVELREKGLDALSREFSLGTRTEAGAPPVWTAATPDTTWETPFA
jgi:hypothetical protein